MTRNSKLKTQNSKLIEDRRAHFFDVKTGVAFTFSNHYSTPDVGGNDGRKMHVFNLRGRKNQESEHIWSWGSDNKLPQWREALIAESGITAELINTKQSILLGGGLVFFKKIIDGEEIRKEYVPEPAWYRALKEEMDMDDYFEVRAKNLLVHANMFTSFVEYKNQRGRRIKSLKAIEGREMRCGLQNEDGLIAHYYWSGNWEKAAKPIRANDRKMADIWQWPTKKYPNYLRGDRKQGVFICHSMDKLIWDGYYASPAWWGDRKWIETVNKIPVFHLHNLENGYVIRYHVEMPEDYFLDKISLRKAAGKQELEKKVYDLEAQKRREFMDKVNGMLADVENAGRALFTTYQINKQLGKEYPGIKINPIETNLQDEALLKLFESANDAASIAQGIHPAVANIQVASKLSSGSEIANAARMYTNIKTPKARRLLLKDLNLVKKLNGTAADRDIHIGFRDLEITDMSIDKTGRQEKTSEVE